MSDEIKKRLAQIQNIQETNSQIFIQLKKLIDETKELVFKENCLKPYLQKCEPEFCSFRILGHCQYFTELDKVSKIIPY